MNKELIEREINIKDFCRNKRQFENNEIRTERDISQ